eukprot:1161480-Pelagomonas_calceolata.AAC.16
MGWTGHMSTGYSGEDAVGADVPGYGLPSPPARAGSFGSHTQTSCVHIQTRERLGARLRHLAGRDTSRDVGSGVHCTIHKVIAATLIQPLPGDPVVCQPGAARAHDSGWEVRSTTSCRTSSRIWELQQSKWA